MGCCLARVPGGLSEGPEAESRQARPNAAEAESQRARPSAAAGAEQARPTVEAEGPPQAQPSAVEAESQQARPTAAEAESAWDLGYPRAEGADCDPTNAERQLEASAPRSWEEGEQVLSVATTGHQVAVRR